jgi:mono/diheme cytochrome c family protein
MKFLSLIILFSTQIPISYADPSNKPLDEACLSDELEAAATASSRTGKEAYQRVCATCHQADGLGQKEVFPPLKGTEWTQYDSVIANIVLRGLSGTITVQGDRYASSMSSFAKDLSDAELVALIQYIQQEFNDRSSTITIEEVSAIRAQELRRVSSQNGLISLQKQYSTQ